jgi:YD repeat-containing protein
MVTYTDAGGNTHVITRDGAHYVVRNGNYVKVAS